eukprot:6196586-Pleurochrysis_carterae.AAC.2
MISLKKNLKKSLHHSRPSPGLGACVYFHVFRGRACRLADGEQTRSCARQQHDGRRGNGRLRAHDVVLQLIAVPAPHVDARTAHSVGAEQTVDLL